jgi:hypothetical protein
MHVIFICVSIFFKFCPALLDALHQGRYLDTEFAMEKFKVLLQSIELLKRSTL